VQRGHRALHPDAERAVPVLRQNPVRRPSRPRPLLSRAGREGRTRRRPGHGRAGSSPGRGPRKGRVTSYSGSKAGPLDPHQVAPVVAACAVTRAARCRESSSGCRARSVSASRIAGPPRPARPQQRREVGPVGDQASGPGVLPLAVHGRADASPPHWRGGLGGARTPPLVICVANEGA